MKILLVRWLLQIPVACCLYSSLCILPFSVTQIFISKVLAGLSFHSLPSFSGRPLGHLAMPVPIGISGKQLWMIFYMLPCASQDWLDQVLPLPFCKSVLHLLSHGTASWARSKADIVCSGHGLCCRCAEAAANDAVKYSPVSSCSQFFDLCMGDEMLSIFVHVCEDFTCSKSCSGWSETSGTSSLAESKLVTTLDKIKNFKNGQFTGFLK